MGVRSPSTVRLPPTRRTHEATERSLAPVIAGTIIRAAMRNFVGGIDGIISRIDFSCSIAVISLRRQKFSSITALAARVIAWVPRVLWKSPSRLLLYPKGLGQGSQVRFAIFYFHSRYCRPLSGGDRLPLWWRGLWQSWGRGICRRACGTFLTAVLNAY